ncbi:MAG: hypothetical protein ABF271_08870 [Abyssibacter sp.]|uniref:hypothetical protein n=1 Tax=Abyssibacter sp. TaxID=2320200 RepID=UPI002EA82936|nr:hypothetical protein [Pseudomonadota bacterium]
MDKTSYLRDLEVRIDDARETLDRLRAEYAEARHQSQHAEIERLEMHLASTEHKMADLRAAGAEAWQEIRVAIDALWEELARWLDARKQP